MSFLGTGTTLQTEFLLFLEHKLLNLQEQLRQSETDKVQLQATLAEMEKRLSDTQLELQAAHTREATSTSTLHEELQSARDELQRASKRFMEEGCREVAKMVLEENDPDVRALRKELEQCKEDLLRAKNDYEMIKKVYAAEIADGWRRKERYDETVRTQEAEIAQLMKERDEARASMREIAKAEMKTAGECARGEQPHHSTSQGGPRRGRGWRG